MYSPSTRLNSAAVVLRRMKDKWDEAIVILLDTGINMWKDQSDTFESNINSLFHYIICKISQSKPTLLSLVTFGSDETDNPLANKNEFQNIKVIKPLSAPSFHLIHHLNEQIGKGSAITDPIDALIVACEMLTQEGKPIKSKTIILFTNDNCCSINSNGLDEITNIFKLSKCKIIIVITNNKTIDIKNNRIVLQQLVKLTENESELIELEEFRKRFCIFIPKPVRIVSSMNGNLIIKPNEIEIPIQCYIRSTQNTLPSPTRTDQFGRLVSIDKTEYTDLDGNLIDSDEIESVFKIGNEFINTNEIIDTTENDLAKGINCLSFIPTDRLSKFSFVGNCLEIFPSSSEKESFCSFCEAMLQTKTYCLAFYVRNQKESPKFGALIPKLENDLYYLYFEYLGSKEDELNQNFTKYKTNCISDEQQMKMNDLVKDISIDQLTVRNPTFEQIQNAILSKIREDN